MALPTNDHALWSRFVSRDNYGLLRFVIATFALAYFTAIPASAQDVETNVSNKGTVAASFLEIGIGARATAMGGAYAAQAGYSEMIYWNPAGLAYIDGPAVSFTHAEWLAETSFDFATVVAPLPFQGMRIGVSLTSLTVPEQPVRTVESPEGTGEFYGANDYALNVALSARIISSFSVGVTGKYVSQRIWTESASQTAIDVGVYYETPFRGLSIGSSISNFGAEMRLSGKNLTTIVDPDLQNSGVENIPVDYRTDSFPLPQIFRFGVSFERAFQEHSSFVATVNLQHPTGTTESMNVGVEYGFNRLIFFRAGYQNLFERDSVNGLTLGAGINYRLRSRASFVMDYAWSDWGILQDVHRFSFGVYL